MIAYGARCSWWDDKSKVGSMDGTPTGLPCCPHCHGVLFEQEEHSWWRDVDRHAEHDPGYRAFVEWARGRCYPGYEEAYAVWLKVRPVATRDVGGDSPAEAKQQNEG